MTVVIRTWYTLKNMQRWFSLLISSTGLLSAFGCGLLFNSEQKADFKSHDYTVLRLDREKNTTWRVIRQGDESDLAFEHKTGVVISVNSVCKQYNKNSLEELLKGLFIGLKSNAPLEIHEAELDGTRALHSTVETQTEDGIMIKVRAWVLRKSGCTYDLMYIARTQVFEQNVGTFDRFLKGFHAK